MRALFLSLALTIGCASAEQTATASPAPPATSAPAAAADVAATADTPVTAGAPDATAPAERRLLFFLNPNGRPCQMQIAILDGMGDSLGDVPVEHVSVLDPVNRPTLYQYGIRSLPSLILVDAEGRELHRFTPGIQQASAISAALERADGA